MGCLEKLSRSRESEYYRLIDRSKALFAFFSSRKKEKRKKNRTSFRLWLLIASCESFSSAFLPSFLPSSTSPSTTTHSTSQATKHARSHLPSHWPGRYVLKEVKRERGRGGERRKTQKQVQDDARREKRNSLSSCSPFLRSFRSRPPPLSGSFSPRSRCRRVFPEYKQALASRTSLKSAEKGRGHAYAK